MATFNPVSIYLNLDSDADFVLRGLYVVCFQALTTFNFQYSGPGGYFYSHAPVPCSVYSYSASQPSPVLPEVVYPAGGVIRMYVQNVPSNPNGTLNFQVVFIGVKRFATDCNEPEDRMFVYPVNFYLTQSGGGRG